MDIIKRLSFWLFSKKTSLLKDMIALEFATDGRFPRATLQTPREKEHVSSSASNALNSIRRDNSKLTREVTLVPAGFSVVASPAGVATFRFFKLLFQKQQSLRKQPSFLSIMGCLLLAGCGTATNNTLETTPANAEATEVEGNEANDAQENEEVQEEEKNIAEETEEAEETVEEDENTEKEVSEDENAHLETVGDQKKLEHLSVHFIDVGQADATLFEFSHDGDDYNILFDAGNWNRNDVVNYLNANDITSLDVMIGSHPHADHIGQMDSILDEFDVDEVWMSGDTTTSQTFDRVLDAIESSGVDYEEPRAGDVFDIGPLEVKTVNPDTLTGDVHEGSLSAKFTYGEVSFLLTGDAEAQTEQAMINRDYDLTADVLQLGHHGSDTSTISEFLSAVSPSIAVVSAGMDNQYGHPHDSVIDRVEEAGVQIYGTHVNGTIVIETDGETIDTLTSNDGTLSPSSTGGGNNSSNDSNESEESGDAEDTSSSNSSTYTCVDINSANLEDLQIIIHIGPSRAEELIELRPFDSLDEMSRINGIAEGRLGEIESEGLACLGG